MPSRIDDTTEEFPSASANGHRPAGHQGRGGAIALSLVVALLAAGLVAAVEGAGDGGGNRPVSVSADRSTVLPLRGGGRVIVPAGAMVDGTKISAGYEGSPGGDIPDARPSGSPVELLADSSDAFKGLVTLELPVASDMASGDVGIATFNEKTRSWVPVPSTFNAARGLVTAQIPHFSWYEPWTWDFASVGARVNQRIGQIVGKRSEAPKCTRGQPVPGWVTSVAGVTTDAAIAIRACTEGEGDVLAVELTNNRPYGMVMTYGSSVKWGWHEPGDSALDRARNKFVDVIIPANQLYLPPGGRASVGIPRVEGGPLNFHIGLTRLAFLADATASIAGEVIGNLNGAACAGWILGGDIGNLASPGAVRDLIKEVEPCVTESLKAAGTAGALDGQTIAKIESTFKTLGKASVIGRILKAYDVEWHLADIWVDTKIVGGVPGLGSGFAVLGRRESAPVTPAGPSAAPAGPAAPRTPATPAATTTTTGTPKTATTAAPNATTTVAPSTTTAAPPTTSTTAMTAPTTSTTTPKTCQSFTVYAQNRWDPQGASLRVAPDHNSQRLGGFAGNTPLIVNGWTYGSRPYPANPVPYESAIWFRLANGSGWVSFPGVRAEPTTYAPNSDDGGPAAPTPSECQV